jgi:peptidoglycan/xylan/chitin deacetylase (PgdA/CDA1 family)
MEPVDRGHQVITRALTRKAVSRFHDRPARLLLKLFREAAFVEAHHWDLYQSPKPIFCLSFDCDAEEDTAAITGTLDLLDAHELTGAFALIGELVEKEPSVYRQIVERGHEIVNHGYLRHTDRRPDGSLFASRFYHELTPEEIRTDIIDNHRALTHLIGADVRGFRTPHFSTFQSPEDRACVYDVCRELGYVYSSSSTSIYLKTGGNWDGYCEIPLTGCWGDLKSPFDSWGLIASPLRHYVDADFTRFFDRMLGSAIRSGRILLNVYFDPSHVVAFPGFHSLLADIATNRDRLWLPTYAELASHRQTGDSLCVAS